MLNNRLHLLSCFLFLYLNVVAQELIPDSLRNSSVEDRIIYLNQTGQNYNDLDSSAIYFNQAVQLTQSCDCDSLKVATLYEQARFFLVRGSSVLGLNKLKQLDKALLKYPDTLYNYKKESYYSYAYYLSENDSLSIKHLENALAYAVLLKDSTRIADTYNNLGKTFIAVNPAKAKAYFNLALNIYKRSNVKASEKQVTYQNLSRVFKEKDSILYYANKAYQHISDTTDAVTMAEFYIDKADALYSRSYYKESEAPALKAYSYSQKIGYDLCSQIALSILGNVAIEKEQYTKAVDYLEKATEFKDISLYNRKPMLEKLAVAYLKNNQSEAALQALNELLVVIDSMHNQQQTAVFAEFDTKFNLAEKDKEIAQQELKIAQQKITQNNWIFGSICAFLLVLVIVFWFINKQKRNKAIVQMNLKKEKEINQMRTKFLGNIAHEIRTPLTLVSGNISLALENLNNKNKAKNNLKNALDNTKKITDDANEILELLKYEDNKTSLQESEIALKTTLERIVYSFESMAQIKEINLIYNSVVPKNVVVKIDIGKVEKIINNLLSNAIKYSPSNAQIIVKDSFSADMLTFSVTDQGEGIHYDEQKKIFERFYQSKNGEQTGGIGVGLSLSKEFAEFLNGQLTVKSALGKGSTFTLMLPVSIVENPTTLKAQPVKKTSDVIKKEATPNSDTKTVVKPKILIVEDNPQMVLYLKEILEDSYQCTSVFNGEDAIELLKDNQFDLITSDIMMPKVDGFALREAVIKLPKYKHTPFIFISAKTLAADKIKGFSLGIADYIVKPFNKNELLARIDNLLKNKQSRDQWQLQNVEQIETESADLELLKKVEAYILENIDNEDFKIKELADYIGYSQRQLTRIMKQSTGLSPVKFILEIRLQRAYALLKNKTYFTLSEVRYAVGIMSSAYFNKKFKERFGVSPSEFI